jgi:hypothetical protein
MRIDVAASHGSRPPARIWCKDRAVPSAGFQRRAGIERQAAAGRRYSGSPFASEPKSQDSLESRRGSDSVCTTRSSGLRAETNGPCGCFLAGGMFVAHSPGWVFVAAERVTSLRRFARVMGSLISLANMGFLLTRLAINRALDRAISHALDHLSRFSPTQPTAPFPTAGEPLSQPPSTSPRSQPPRRPGRPAGISNRPLEEELRSQARVLPRGTALGETDPLLLPRPDQHPAPKDPSPKRRRAKYPMPE